MVVKHIGASGRVRRTFENVSSFHQHQGNNVVSVNREAILTLPPDNRAPALPSQYWKSTYEFPLALIHLAEGESVEREDDEPARS